MDSSVYNVCCHVWCTHLLNHSRGADQKLLLKELKPADSLWLYPLFMEVELSAHCKNHQWSKSSLGGWSTCFSSCNDTYFCQCRNLQIEKLGFFFTEPFSWLSLSGVRKWLCTCAQLPSVFLVSSVLLKAIRSLLSPSVTLSKLKLPLLSARCRQYRLSNKLCGNITWFRGSSDGLWRLFIERDELIGVYQSHLAHCIIF